MGEKGEREGKKKGGGRMKRPSHIHRCTHMHISIMYDDFFCVIFVPLHGDIIGVVLAEGDVRGNKWRSNKI